MQALVCRSTGNWYQVKAADGQTFKARLKGRFKIEGITSTNPIAVGDMVDLETGEGDESVVITGIHTRRNYINRVSPHNRNMHHIIAANLDQSLLFATLVEPKTSLGFVDRFLVVSEAYHVPAIIVFNKIDLYKKKENEKLVWATELYREIGYTVIHTSVETGEGMNETRELLNNKTTLLSGQSGVGKSSLINYLLPELEIKTQDVSGWSGKGLHTTTFAEMYDIEGGGKIIDTPGIREMGLVDIPKQELSHYFPEMRKLLNDCRFNNCMHTNESGCAVKMAVGKEVHEERYISYLKILDTMDDKAY
ncbi:MAG: ribosome small subunit-dependent GTPase A [Chitinophagaceae bacterium]|nr:MAG: ribosome small subunit-dependent GTPase A [Chitinophagaceae bacterium]